MYKIQLLKIFSYEKIDLQFKILVLKIFFAACKIHIYTFYISFRKLPIFYTFTIARKTNVTSAALFKTFGNETAHIFSPKQIYASYKSTPFFTNNSDP